MSPIIERWENSRNGIVVSWHVGFAERLKVYLLSIVCSEVSEWHASASGSSSVRNPARQSMRNALAECQILDVPPRLAHQTDVP